MQTQQPQKVEPADEKRTRGWPIALAVAAVIVLVVGAISLLATSNGTEPATVAPAPVPPKTVQIEAFDYGYNGFDVEIAAGDALELFNTSETEFHNLVVLFLEDDDTRTVVEIAETAPEDIDVGGSGFAIPRGGQEPIVTAIGHLEAAPGEDAFNNGRIRLQRAGRYIAFDMIAQGADPLTVRSATDTNAPPYLVAGGPLGYQHGMIVEFFVIER
jgi:hypothetical protein